MYDESIHYTTTNGSERWREDATEEKPRALVLHKSESAESNFENPAEEAELLRDEIAQLRAKLKSKSSGPAAPDYRSQTFHYLDDACFLDEPRWETGEYAPTLQANSKISNVSYYLEQHPEIAFFFMKDYKSRAPADRTKIETRDGVFRTPKPFEESLQLLAGAMRDAVNKVVRKVPNFSEYFPHFDVRKPIVAPYLFMFHSAPHLDDILEKIDGLSRRLIQKLWSHINEGYGVQYLRAREKTKDGKVSAELLKYLIKPGDILAHPDGPNTRAYMALQWPEEDPPPDDGHPEDYEEFDPIRRKETYSFRDDTNIKTLRYSWSIPVAFWEFDGVFQRSEKVLKITMKVSMRDEIVEINSLKFYPLQYAPKTIEQSLEHRGNTFWQIRSRKFVSYSQKEPGNLTNAEERFMVDIETFKALHPSSSLARAFLRDDLGSAIVAGNDPFPDGFLLLLPPTVPGYNMLHKKWVDLFVDQISDITWNKQAFKDLVVDLEIKELVQALVTNQLTSVKSTDVISGKGNGLILLLHGGPGTGKTFTAEGVAEFAEKPLFRVTCGDVGTEAREVETMLQAAFHLGKIWDCVVLLDEADVFLEERDMRDLNRNALVSVFLRALEYHNGILILTSNRVGTFDEAFKSRIQLALHYENLTKSQRRKIWRNFMGRLKDIDEDNIEFEDVIDNLDELSSHDINGREIRNALTTARQLALFKGEKMGSAHLKKVLRVSGIFGKYLKDLRGGLTDDLLKHESGVRHSYSVKKAASFG
ncbi:unnamed protein product [Penicillium manginii]